VAFDNLLSENVIDEISYEDSGSRTVTIEGCYGLNRSLKRKSIGVINFTDQAYIVLGAGFESVSNQELKFDCANAQKFNYTFGLISKKSTNF
jgi:hypothetical protein